MNIEKTIDIMEPGAVLTDEQLAQIQADADLREACQDIMILQGQLAPQPDTEVALEHFIEKHHPADVPSVVTLSQPHSENTRPLASRLKWVALAAALFAGALFLLWPARHSTEESLLAQQAELAEKTTIEGVPDGFGVTVTTADGKQQQITGEKPDDAADEVVDVIGSSSRKRHVVGQIMAGTSTLTVPYGHSVLVNLSDGTRVYLRPGSSLIYPDEFIDDSRIVSLKGEAYFCVARDARPFIVGTQHGIIRDYGTDFNICAESNKTEVVLVEGSVGVMGKKVAEHLLHPGQKATLDASTPLLNIEEVDTDPYTAWRDGYFYFNEQTIGDIITQLAYSYNLTIECHNTDLLRLRLRYIIPRNSTAAYAIEILDRLQSGHISLEGNRIVVK